VFGEFDDRADEQEPQEIGVVQDTERAGTATCLLRFADYFTLP
jgi:hypothetical protein